MSAVSKKTTRSFGTGLVVVALLAVVVYLAVTANRGLPFQQTTQVRVAFDNIATLRAGDNVKQNSVRIGKVSEVGIEDGQAVATLEIDPDITVYRDARAMIADESSLAKRFVELEPGSTEAGDLGDDVLPIKQTMAATDINDLLDVFDAKTRDRLQVAVRGLGNGATGHSDDLHDLMVNGPELLDDVTTILATLRSDETDLPALLTEADQLARSFQGHEDDLRATIRQLPPTLEALNTDQGRPLQATIRALPGFLNEAANGLKAVNPVLNETRLAVRDLRPGARALGRTTPTVRAVLREGVSPLEKVPGIAEQANPAVDSLTGTLEDASPLAPNLTEALTNLERPLQVLAPYSRDVMVFFSRANSLVSTTTPTGDHMARLGVAIPGLLPLVGGGVIADPDTHRVAYPAPGAVDDYRLPGISIPTGVDR